jgi:hypothetical protein
MNMTFISGKISLPGQDIPQITTELKITDFLGAVMVRWGFRRDKYRVEPGLYAVGNPGQESDVFVTSNYKLTFDQVRKNLSGINGWVLVLDTKGINVWCAAGKGTFGTKELVKRIRLAGLERIVTHRRLILPQLGATGVAAHKVREETGFNVHYGPVLASDIKRFLEAGYRADSDMRKVKFRFTDRARLIPNDFMYGKYYLLAAMAVVFILSGLNRNGLSFSAIKNDGGSSLLFVFLAYLAGIVMTPLFLPYLPGRHFSLKGFFAGLAVFVLFLITGPAEENILIKSSWLFIIGSIASFGAMNFTGSSTYTSLSGVKKEMKLFLPLQITFAAVGIILLIVGKLI